MDGTQLITKTYEPEKVNAQLVKMKYKKI